MKKCVPCGHVSADETSSCSNCGEASWLELQGEPAPSEAPTVPDVAPTKRKTK